MITHDITSIAMLKKAALTVCVSESTGTNIAVSLQVAEHIGKSAGLGNVLYLNTIQTGRQLADSIRKHANKEYPENSDDRRITYESSPVGLLLDDKKVFENYITEREIAYVIINSWEFASRDYRRKADLIYLLNGWMDRYGLTVLVFAERMKNAPESQRIQRGIGVGKLSAIAQEVKILREGKPDKRKSEVGDIKKPEHKWDAYKDIFICRAYEEIHGKIEQEEDEIWMDCRLRVRELARVEGFIDKEGNLKKELKHIAEPLYRYNKADKELIKRLKAEEEAEEAMAGSRMALACDGEMEEGGEVRSLKSDVRSQGNEEMVDEEEDEDLEEGGEVRSLKSDVRSQGKVEMVGEEEGEDDGDDDDDDIIEDEDDEFEDDDNEDEYSDELTEDDELEDGQECEVIGLAAGFSEEGKKRARAKLL